MCILWSVVAVKVLSMFPPCSILLPQMAPCASLLPWSPGFQAKQVYVFFTFTSTLKTKYIKHFFLTASIPTLKNEYPSTHRLFSGHHWPCLLGSNDLIISQIYRANFPWASLSTDQWLAAAKLTCTEGMLLNHQGGQHWSTVSGCKGTCKSFCFG